MKNARTFWRCITRIKRASIRGKMLIGIAVFALAFGTSCDSLLAQFGDTGGGGDDTNTGASVIHFQRHGNGYQVVGRNRHGGTLSIPETHNGLPVTSIGANAFEVNGLTSVTIPSSITFIGDRAFASNQLTSVVIPNSVTHIGSGAFSWNNLTFADIPNSVTHIGDEAFARNNLTFVVIPNSVTHIGSSAFSENQITNVTIPDSITHIEGETFFRNNLTFVDIPNSVTHIGDWAFGGNQITNVTIPDSVTHIVGRAFEGNSLVSVTIPNSVTYIGNTAFHGNNLTSVTIPDSVTHIGDWAFGWNNLTSVTIGSSVTHIGSVAFYWNNLTSVTIPDNVIHVGMSAFGGNNLTSVSIPFASLAAADAVWGGSSWRGGIPHGVTWHFSSGNQGGIPAIPSNFLGTWVYGPDSFLFGFPLTMVLTITSSGWSMSENGIDRGSGTHEYNASTSVLALNSGGARYGSVFFQTGAVGLMYVGRVMGTEPSFALLFSPQ